MDEKVWQLRPGYGSGARPWLIAIIALLVAGGVALAFLVGGPGEPDAIDVGGWAPYLGIAVAVVALAIPFLQRRGGAGLLRLTPDALAIQTRRGLRSFALGDLRLSLARVYVADNFMGSLGLLRVPRRDQPIRLLGAGAELAPGRYDAADVRTYRFDHALDAASFHELLAALAAAGVRPAAPAGVGPTAMATPTPTSPRRTDPGEQVFEAAPGPMRAILRTVALSFGGVALLAVAGVALHAFGPIGEGSQEVQAVVMTSVAAAVLILVSRSVFRRGRKTFLRFSPRSLSVASGRRTHFATELPPALVAVRLWRTSSRYGSHTQGPAIHLRDRFGRTVTLGVREPSLPVPADAPRVGRVDYVLSGDAGRALLATLRAADLLP